MDFHTATEESYKNGYRKGYEDGKSDAVKHGYWIIRYRGLIDSRVDCSECGTVGCLQWKCCPVCETRMDGVIQK